MVFIVYILSITYALFICWCIAGWMRLPGEEKNVSTNEIIFVSVIIPARNEEEQILNCLNDFLVQDYPIDFFEVIVVNDHSTDATAAIVNKFIETHFTFKIRLIEPDLIAGNKLYKKEAI